MLALQGDVANHLRMLDQAGAGRAATIRRERELAEVDALVLPGGESSVIDKLARRVGLFDPLRQRIADGMPVLGTCAGMILLADTIEGAVDGQRTFGGLDVVVRRNAFGRQVDSFEAQVPIDGVDEPERPFPAVFIRAPWVQSVGPQVRVLASVQDASGSHVVAVRQGAVMATSFHPELTGDPRVHAAFVRLARLA